MYVNRFFPNDVGRKGAAMIYYCGIVVVLVVCINFAISLSFWRKAKKSENIRRENENMKREYFKQEGMPVNAKIMNVVLHEDRKQYEVCLLYTSPSPRDRQKSRMPSSA